MNIEVTVANTGGEEGTVEVVLKLNGEIADSAEVTLDPGAEEKVSFTFVSRAIGTYDVDVNGLTGTFTVEEKPEEIEPTEFDWTFYSGIAAAIVIAAVVVFLLVRRRRAA